MEYIAHDEYLEVTPKSLRIRKILLGRERPQEGRQVDRGVQLDHSLSNLGTPTFWVGVRLFGYPRRT
jgi:hypothetical protein